MALKHVYYHVRNELPVYVRYRMLEAGAWGIPREMIGGERWVIEDPAVIYVGEYFAYVLL